MRGSNILSDSLDGYSAGPLMTTNYLPTVDPDRTLANRVGRPWPGANSYSNYFTLSELLDGTRTSYPFTNRLLSASMRTNDTYDRTTFYRLLAQLGTESAPEPPRLNLNYINVDRFGTVVPNMETNF
jgi:hypothetical protein